MLGTLQQIVGEDGTYTGTNTQCVTVMPATVNQVSEVVQWCVRHAVPLTHSPGPAAARAGEMVLFDFSRMNRILDIDTRNRRLIAEPGVHMRDLTGALSVHGFVCAEERVTDGAPTLGEQILRGAFAQAVVGLEIVQPSGQVVTLGDKSEDTPGYDLLQLAIDPRAPLGIIIQATLRITQA